MEKLLVKFHADCGRSGDLNGLFICTREDIEKIKGRSTWYYDELGKHSEIELVFNDNDPDLEIVSTDNELISRLEEVFKGVTLSGLNPVQKILDEMEE